MSVGPGFSLGGTNSGPGLLLEFLFDNSRPYTCTSIQDVRFHVLSIELVTNQGANLLLKNPIHTNNPSNFVLLLYIHAIYKCRYHDLINRAQTENCQPLLVKSEFRK